MSDNIKSLKALVDKHQAIIAPALQQLQDQLHNHRQSVAFIQPSDSDYLYYADVVSNEIHDLAEHVNNTLSLWSK